MKKNAKDLFELRERLAALEHEQWLTWSRALAQECSLPREILERWWKQWKTYEELPEDQKETDRFWADQVLSLLSKSSSL
ncbi:MAG TPA: hypothetical protein VJB99_02480 [Patescibacteria group bacterium]|nr:hypothetical protein [Patescibacteria group bacterium]